MEDITDEKSSNSPERAASEADGAEPHTRSEAAEAETKTQPDGANFLRCSNCAHAEDVDASAGALFCRKHNMHINAEADEIPDDCVEFEVRSAEKSKG